MADERVDVRVLEQLDVFDIGPAVDVGQPVSRLRRELLTPEEEVEGVPAMTARLVLGREFSADVGERRASNQTRTDDVVSGIVVERFRRAKQVGVRRDEEGALECE